MAAAKQSKALKDIRASRRLLRLSQTEFWGIFGMTQSAGSRYEGGRAVPTPIAMLIVLKEAGVLSDEQLQLAKKVVENTLGAGNSDKV